MGLDNVFSAFWHQAIIKAKNPVTLQDEGDEAMQTICKHRMHLSWASCQIRTFAGCACAGNVGNVFPPPWVSDPDIHHGAWVTHMSWCMPVSLTSGFLWSRRRGKRSRYSRCMRNPQFYLSGWRPIVKPFRGRSLAPLAELVLITSSI